MWCSSRPGGCDLSYTRNYSLALLSHNTLHVSLRIWSITEFFNNINSTIKISIDGTNYTFSLAHAPWDVETEDCGDWRGTVGRATDVYLTLPHYQNYASISIHSQVDSGFNAITFQNLNITTSYLGLPVSSCARGTTPLTTDANISPCSCPAGTYNSPYDSGNCSLCHPDCLTCAGSDSNLCLSCSNGSQLFNGTCVA